MRTQVSVAKTVDNNFNRTQQPWLLTWTV